MDCDVTQSFERLREAARHLWNCYFSEMDDTLAQAEALLRFRKIEKALFELLVCAENSKEGVVVLVVPKDSRAQLNSYQGVELSNGNMSWRALDKLPTDISEFKYIELFDWNWYGPVDLNSVKCTGRSGRDGKPTIFLMPFSGVSFVIRQA